MSRIRTIKPEFWDDEKLSTIKRDARLLFIALWTFSDDYGVVKGNTTWLKNKIFPYDDIRQSEFNSWIEDLHRIRVIIPFNANGEQYFYIRTFKAHQKIDRPSKTQKNPDPPSNIIEMSDNFSDSTNTRRALDEPSTSPRRALDEPSTSLRRALVAVREGKVREGNNTTSHPSSTAVDDGGVAKSFDAFWNAYPRKIGKQAALRAWKRTNGSRPPLKKIIEAVEAQRQSEQWTRDGGQYIPHPATWINQGRWDDQVEIAVQSDGDRLRMWAEDRMRARGDPLPPDDRSGIETEDRMREGEEWT